MAQAGIHALLGAATRKIMPKRDWLMLGIVLGSLFPDLDNFVVAVATVARLNTEGLHRTFTHSLLAVILAVVVFVLLALLSKQPRWANLGIGLGIGISLHIVLDLLLWFNGVELLWPFGGWINFWDGVNVPAWFARLMDPLEFLFFGLFFAWLGLTARAHKTDLDFRLAIRGWTVAMFILLVVFTPLAILMGNGFQTIFGALYLVSLTAAMVITIRMRKTIEAYG
jgi:membrane-bound metal-dependent hydrolase YbcI (DUF457 family)